MRPTSFVVTLIMLGSSCHIISAINFPTCDSGLLWKSINALNLSLEYMAKHKSKINLDGAFGNRLCADQLRGFLKSIASFNVPREITEKLNHLSTLADNTVKSSIPYLKESDPEYFKIVGFVLTPGKWGMSYGLRQLNHSLMDPKPLPCSEKRFKEDLSDFCFNELLKKCHISKKCVKYMTGTGTKAYRLTHVVLYLLAAEGFGCLKEVLRQSSTDLDTLQDSLCINVLRDAEDTQKHDYPIQYHDLFLEQIGLCGTLGYVDFLKQQWMEKIFEWQRPSGCYKLSKVSICEDNLKNEHVRRKREDVALQNNCSSHKTGVAIVALTVEIQLCIRTMFERYSMKR